MEGVGGREEQPGNVDADWAGLGHLVGVRLSLDHTPDAGQVRPSRFDRSLALAMETWSSIQPTLGGRLGVAPGPNRGDGPRAKWGP